MTPTDTASSKRRKKNVLIAITGNFLEMFDFMVYGFYAAIIAEVLFPSNDPNFVLIMSWVTFGIGSLARPLGALVLGAYADKYGRRAGLILSLSLMTVGIVAIAIVPPYSAIGMLAPVIVIVARLLQGFSAGAESGTVSVYLAEIAPPNRTGLYASLQTWSQQLSVIFAASIGVGLKFALTPEEINSWGWRVPFVIGCMLIPFLLVARRKMDDSHSFVAQKQHPGIKTILMTLLGSWRLIGTAILMVMLTAVMFYLLTSYITTFGTKILNLPMLDSFLVAIAFGVVNLFVLPLSGYLSDRIGRAPVLLGASLAIAVFAYPAMAWLVSAPSFERLLATVAFLGMLYGAWQGTLIVSLVEMMPANIRSSGWSLAYSLAYAIFGGFTPALVTWLIAETGNKAMPGIAVTVAACFAFVGVCLARKRLKAVRLDAQSKTIGDALGHAPQLTA